ncbi:MAG: DNA lyase [Candidatus Nanohaloarchaea archaeon]
MNPEELRKEYQEKNDQIQSRLEDFRKLRDADDERLFEELVFVLLTSQTRAEKAWEAAEELRERGLLMEGSEEEIARVLQDNSVQYERNKAGYIIRNRKILSQPTLKEPGGGLKLKNRVSHEDLGKTRSWVVENMEGMGWKGASHFLRNIGYGNGFAIISGHIARKLHQLDVTETPEPPSGKEEYLETEEKMQAFSEQIGIPVKELDLLLWSLETGEVFK